MENTQPQDPRDLLAKMEAEEAAAQQRVEQLIGQNKAKKEEVLKQLRAIDLADVIAKCKRHRFTPTDLRGALKTKGVSAKGTTTKSRSKSPSTADTDA